VNRVRVGDVLELQRRPVDVDPVAEYLPIGIRSFGKGIFHYPATLGANLSRLRFFEIQPDELVVSNIKAWEGAVAVSSPAEVGRIASNRFLSYAPRDGQIDVRYAAYYFLSERGNSLIQRASPGSADRNRTLAIDRFEALEIPLPPLSEQESVANYLDGLSIKTAALRSAVARSGLGFDVLPQAFASDVIDEISRDSRPLEEFASITRGKGPKYDPDSAHAIINQACVKWDGLDLNNVKYVSPDWSGLEDPRAQVSAGDVLVNSTGEGTLGRACVVPASAEGTAFDSHVLRVRTDRSRLDPHFLTVFIRSRQGQEAINLAKGATTTKQTELGSTKLGALEVPVLAVAEQERIASEFELLKQRVQELKLRQREARREAEALWSSALNRAFATAQ
jgi:type I restriction enzyme, S subunit